MKTAVTSLLLTLTLGLVSCSSTGGPSGSLVGLITGGVLGAAGDEYLYNDDDNGTGTSSSSNGTSSGTGGTVVGGSPPLLSSDVTTTTTDENGLTTTESTKTNNSFLTEGLGGNNNTNNNQSTLDRHRGLVTGAVAGLAAGAVSDMFRKNEVQKKYDEGYAKAKSDAIKEFYWIKRDAEKKKNGGDDPPVQYRYYEVEVPAHITSDGVFIDRHKRVIEVVE